MIDNGRRKTSCLTIIGFLLVVIATFIVIVPGTILIAVIGSFYAMFWYQNFFLPNLYANPAGTIFVVFSVLTVLGLVLMGIHELAVLLSKIISGISNRIARRKRVQ